MMKIRTAVFAGILGVALTAGTAAAASASTVPANFPGNTGTSCNAWHGAPGGFGPASPYYFVRTDTDFGQEQGVVTGQGNAAFSAACQA